MCFYHVCTDAWSIFNMDFCMGHLINDEKKVKGPVMGPIRAHSTRAVCKMHNPYLQNLVFNEIVGTHTQWLLCVQDLKEAAVSMAKEIELLEVSKRFRPLFILRPLFLLAAFFSPTFSIYGNHMANFNVNMLMMFKKAVGRLCGILLYRGATPNRTTAGGQFNQH